MKERKFIQNKGSKLFMKKIVGYNTVPFSDQKVPVFEEIECIQDVNLGSVMNPNKEVVGFKYDIPRMQ